MAVYSFSQVQLFLKCPLRYRFKYLDNIELEEFEQTADLFLWNAVHFVLERLYSDHSNFKNISDQDLLKYYVDFWNDTSAQQIVVRAWKSLDDYKIRGSNYITNYFSKYFNQNPSDVIATESKIVFDLSDNIKFRWVIDRIDKDWDTFVINDYKTNKNLPPEQKDEYLDQITLYWLWIIQKYWKYLNKIKWRLYFLHFDIIDEWEISQEALNAVISKYKNVIIDIESKKLKFEQWDKNQFQPIESPNCKYCEYKTICPLFTHINHDDEVVTWLSEKTIKTLIDEFVELTQQYNKIKWQKESLKEILVKYLEDKDFKRLYWNKWTISVAQSVNYSIEDKDWARNVLKNLWLESDVVDIDRNKLIKLIKEWKIDFELLRDFVKQSQVYTLRAK